MQTMYIDLLGNIIFTKLESTRQRHTKVMYKIYSGADCNLMLFKIFR